MPKKSAVVAAKSTFEAKHDYTIQGKSVTLVAKGEFNEKDATWKVKTDITTNKIDPNDTVQTEAVLERLKQLVRDVIDECKNRRKEVLKARPELDPQQMKIGGDLTGIPAETKTGDDGEPSEDEGGKVKKIGEAKKATRQRKSANGDSKN